MTNIRKVEFQTRISTSVFVDFDKGSNFLSCEPVIQALKNRIANDVESVIGDLNCSSNNTINYEVFPPELMYSITPFSGTIPETVFDTDLNIIDNTVEYSVPLFDALELIAKSPGLELVIPDDVKITKSNFNPLVVLRRIKRNTDY